MSKCWYRDISLDENPLTLSTGAALLTGSLYNETMTCLIESMSWVTSEIGGRDIDPFCCWVTVSSSFSMMSSSDISHGESLSDSAELPSDSEAVKEGRSSNDTLVPSTRDSTMSGEVSVMMP
jgi:hypothetical protein